MFRCRCLSMWGMRGGKCLPSGKCSNDWKRRNGRLEPLRYFLLGEIPFVVILLIVTVVVSIYYAGQAHELPNNTIVGTDFNWYTGCADEYGLFSDTSSYHTLVTWSPFIVLFIIFGIGVPLRLSATSTWCNFCLQVRAWDRARGAIARTRMGHTDAGNGKVNELLESTL